MAEPFKFRRVNEITGTFVLIVFAIVIAAVVWTGRSQRWFKSNVTLRITLPADGAAGIRQGSEVIFWARSWGRFPMSSWTRPAACKLRRASAAISSGLCAPIPLRL